MESFSLHRLTEEHPDLFEAARRLSYLARVYDVPRDLILCGVAWDVEGVLQKAVKKLIKGAIYEG